MSTVWPPEIVHAALDFLDEMRQMQLAEDAPHPHVLLVVDPESVPDYEGPVIGPYPNRAAAAQAALAKAEELNRGNTDTPFQVHVVRFWPAKA